MFVLRINVWSNAYCLMYFWIFRSRVSSRHYGDTLRVRLSLHFVTKPILPPCPRSIICYFGCFLDLLIDLSLEAWRPVYIQTWLPYPYSSPYLYPFAYPFALIWAALHWYEPHSWGISSYTNCISNGPEHWGSRCRYTQHHTPVDVEW